MSPNREQPHVLVLPEDDANRQLANGFHLQVDSTLQRQLQVLPVAGGWGEVLNLFEEEHVAEMDRWPRRLMVLLIDFDGIKDRWQDAKARVPERLTDRVFILGVLDEPEDLKADLGSYEKIGSLIATDCREGTDTTWRHKLLQHNAGELERLRDTVCPILFE
jgi:hypothetical protein